MPHASINNIDLYYEDGGTGAPVIFVHGGFPSLATTLNDFEMWTWTWEEDFARHFHFIYYERRGCYRSACPDSGYDLENQARDLACLLDHLQIDSAHLIGSSAGGPISIVFAALWPQRIRSLVLAGTGLNLFPQGDPDSDLVREHIALLDQVGPERAFEQRPAGVEATFLSLWQPREEEARGRLPAFLAHEQWVREQVQHVPTARRVQYYAAELRGMQAYMQRDLYADARQVTCPTLVLHGSDDRMDPLPYGEELAQTIPNAQLRVIPGGGHSLIHRTIVGRNIAIEFFLTDTWKGKMPCQMTQSSSFPTTPTGPPFLHNWPEIFDPRSAM